MTATKKISKVEALAALARTVEKYGRDTRYQKRAEKVGAPTDRCKYTNGKRSAACLIGVVLREEFDVPISVLRRCDERSQSTIVALNNSGVSGLPVFTDAAAHALRRAQTTQDSGGTWGDALAYAKHPAYVKHS